MIFTVYKFCLLCAIYAFFGAHTLVYIQRVADNETLVLWACATVSAIAWPVFWVALFVCAGIEYVKEHMT